MKRALGLFLAVIVFSCASTASAQEEISAGVDVGEGGFLSSLRFGVHVGLGMADTVGDMDRIMKNAVGEEATPRFTMGVGLSAQYFLLPMLALDVGIGFLGKGFLVQPGSDEKYYTKLTYMEIPLGVLLEIEGFQAGLALAINIALAGKEVAKDGNTKVENKWAGSDWDEYIRFNLAPKFMVGYAIPFDLAFGKLFLIPGLDFSVHLIDEYDGPSDKDYSFRSWNMMFRIGAALQLL
jgi:hypothetical protein